MPWNKLLDSELTHDQQEKNDHTAFLTKEIERQLTPHRNEVAMTGKADAFKKYMQATHQLQSQVTVLTDFRRPFTLPNLEVHDRHSQIKSTPLENYDASNDERLDNIQAYIYAKEGYSRQLHELDNNLSETEKKKKFQIMPSLS
ncbi:MAG: hypothetical protein NXI01_08865 [Gammaproteobacteria bacterium]|nr:hypothetical protein [Gammaproteobacteria bacterium]